ncbi:shikimate dehydrogenase family protein [Prochlorococcus marinus]|uniref:shikimate dehydrogenase family protein n=1 Tax=Prochlorococcus marinus TaxID=1219 RepID=UPI000190060F|nr:shikimate dehydrogenase [Prochlorococcus marinus]EEE41066.1 putative shikimate dehydrogenase [Prochlorococcus marinus str. MIT 9202]
MVYSAIIGLNPSKGARSPILWNKAYKHLKINAEMICIDIEDEEILFEKLNQLNQDKSFQGGAIAFPYKESVFKWLNGNVEDEVKSVGSVNNLYRDSNNQLKGSNTDGIAAKLSFNRKFNNEKLRKVLFLGYGGAGKAVCAYLGSEFLNQNSNNKLYLATRDIKDSEKVKHLGIEWIDWNAFNKLNVVTTIINCTSLGNQLNKNSSPINIDFLKNNPVKECFDIIYDPLETIFLREANKNKISTLNGLNMNLLQAAVAFKNCNYVNLSSQQIVEIMDL